MIRIHCLQHWFNLSDPSMEESLHESVSMRQFAGIDLGCEPVPDETTICKFRHLLEKHELGKRMLEEIWRHLQECGFQVAKGAIVDATIIKRIFGFAKVRYRGFMKNANRPFVTCALANLYMVCRQLLRMQRGTCVQ